MMISDEQARRAVELLRVGTGPQQEAHMPTVDPSVIEEALRLARRAPDARQDRIAEARWMLAQHPPTAEEVAAKMLSRIASDSIR